MTTGPGYTEDEAHDMDALADIFGPDTVAALMPAVDATIREDQQQP